jgi:hypothetical protein
MGLPVEVLPEDGMEPPPEPLGQSTCLGCHAREPGENEAPSAPVQAMDLRGDPALACAQAKFWIDTKDRARSVILLNPTGKGNTLHPMKPVAEDDPIIQGIRAWVDAEQ